MTLIDFKNISSKGNVQTLNELIRSSFSQKQSTVDVSFFYDEKIPRKTNKISLPHTP